MKKIPIWLLPWAAKREIERLRLEIQQKDEASKKLLNWIHTTHGLGGVVVSRGVKDLLKK